MKTKALWMLLAFIPALSASTITCTTGAATVPVFNPSSTSGAVGDYTIDCTGGTPVTPPNPVPVINVDVSVNVSVLNTEGWVLTDGVNMTSGVLGAANLIEFLGVPFDPPGTADLLFQVENIFVDPSAEAPGFQFKEDVGISGNSSIFVPNTVQLVAVNAVPEPSLTWVFVGLVLTMWLVRRPTLT
jgi:hypothetical protein